METKELVESIQSATATLRQNADLMAEESKKFGASTVETKQVIEKVNTRIDTLETELRKTALVKPGDGKASDPAKAAHKAAFIKWMRTGKASLEPAEKKALVEDVTGGYLIPEDIMAEIIRGVPQLNFMRQLCPAITVGRDKLRKRTLTELTMSWGKIEGSASISESTQTPVSGDIYVEDLYGLTKIGEDELSDVDFDLAAVIADSFSVARANAEAAGFVTGRGHATYEEPEGIAVNATLLTGIGSGANAGTVGTYGRNWTTDDTAIFEDVIKLEYALPSQYLPGSAWLMSRKTECDLRVLRAGGYTAVDGPWLWQPSMQAGAPNMVDGFPVYNSAVMKYPADTTAGANIIFGNFRQGYRIIDRLGMSIVRLDELYAESGLVGFKSHFRVGGAVIRPEAFQVLCNDT